MPQPEEQAGSQISKPAIVRFAVYEANLRTGELRKHGNRMRLQEQPFQVLALLLERRGEAVSREELRQKLWPTDTFVDFDHGLNSAVARLRGALNDSADSPKYIETVGRRGYRFIAKIDEQIGPLAAQKKTSSSASIADNLPTAIPRRRLLVAFACIGAAALVVTGMYLAGIRTRSRPLGKSINSVAVL